MSLCQQGNIITCGVIGAYAVILAVNAYIYTSLSYITLNILKRLLNSSYSAAFTDVPFQIIGEFDGAHRHRRRRYPSVSVSTLSLPSLLQTLP